MWLAGLRVRARTPIHDMRALDASVEHRVDEIGQHGNQCAFVFAATPPPGATNACQGICDDVRVEGAAVRASCRPAKESACALRRANAVHLVELLRPRGVLESVTPDGESSQLQFLLRGADEPGVRDALAAALKTASLSAATTRLAPLSLSPLADAKQLRRIETETLTTALRLGYYEVPRRCTMDDIGRELGITKSAVYHRLSQIEGKVLKALGEGLRAADAAVPETHEL